jgi:Cd2+/Zn2+-exporting ATPase
VEAGAWSAEQLQRAVAATGMRATPWSEGDGEPAEEGFWQRRGRTLMCWASGALLALGFGLQSLLAGGPLAALTAGAGHALPPWVILCYLGAAVTGGWYVFPKALLAARRLRPDMNLLMTIAVIGAMLIGDYLEAATVALLFAVALLLESWSVGRARRAIQQLVALSPASARYRCPTDGDIMQRPVEQVPAGAVVLVRPGESIPLDGVVLSGSTSVDQAPITGESAPVDKQPGDEVWAGTINGEGAFEFRSTAGATDTQLARIIRMVEEAQSRRAPAEQWVERFARIYTPAMLGLAAAVALVPPLVLGGGWGGWLYQALVLLVIACPCALVISTPVSIVAGLTTAARNGVLIKGGVYLEAPARLRALAMDKTGTLTHGRPVVRALIPREGVDHGELLRIAAALEANSAHPLARAIVARAAAEGLELEPAGEFQSLTGLGAEGSVGGQRHWIGSRRLLEQRAEASAELDRQARELEREGCSVVAVGAGPQVQGLLGVADEVRAEAAAAIRELKRLGLSPIVMLTGDNRRTAEAVAAATGVDQARSGLLPADKVQAVTELTGEHGRVAMVGDGVNDAPALAASSLGVAMGAMGSAAAVETADVALMSDDLSRLPWLVRHSRRTLGVIKQNIGFALGLKAAFIALALAGLATLWMAIAADMGASLLVIFNGLRLLGGAAPGAEGAGRRPTAAGPGSSGTAAPRPGGCCGSPFGCAAD